jgi:predicted membrane-bound mannosyltransferase
VTSSTSPTSQTGPTGPTCPTGPTSPTRATWALLLLIALAAFALRLADAGDRPMHTDEAVNALILGEMLAGEPFRYSPQDHHGPLPFHLGAGIVRLLGADSLATLEAWQTRVLPALAGALLVLAPALFAGSLGPAGVAAAALWLACCAPFVYYGGYWIHETTFVLLSMLLLASVWRYMEDARRRWVVSAGICLGLLAASKETAVLTVAALAVAWVATRIWTRTGPPFGGTRAVGSTAAAEVGPPFGGTRAVGSAADPEVGPPFGGARAVGSTADTEVGPPFGGTRAVGSTADPEVGPPSGKRWRVALPRDRLGAAAGATAIALLVALLFYSSFGRNPSGITDLWHAAGRFFARAGGEGHEKPWFTYLAWWLAPNLRTLPWGGWTLAIAACAGAVLAVRRRQAQPFQFFLLSFTLATLGVYALIPYKTPWLALNFLTPAALLGGVGVQALWAGSGRLRLPVAVAITSLLLLATGAETWRLCFRFPVDPGNPLAYAPTVPDVALLQARIEAYAAAQPDGMATPVHVAAADYWPLPWYLRRLPNTGYLTDFPAPWPAQVVIASLEQADSIAAALGPDWRSAFFGLRPGVLVVVFLKAEG